MRQGKALYLTLPVVLLMVAAGVYLWAPTGIVTVSAQRSSLNTIHPTEPARADQLRMALDLRSAHDLAAYGGGGMSENGTTLRGVRADQFSDSNRGDLDRSLKIINQLPCTDLNMTDLAGKSVAPGVYCLPSMNLTGQVTLDGEGDPNATFVFVTKGGITAGSEAGMSLVRGARASNVYFASNETVDVDAGVVFKGTILARKSVTVKQGDVEGRVLSVDGAVDIDGTSVGGGTGILEICKDQQGTGLEGRVFRFRIGALIVEAPVGSCTGPIELATGNIVIEELTSGRTIAPLPIGTWNGRFKLVDVNSPTPGALGAVNLPARTANVFIREGDINNMTVVRFVNTFAITGIIEICKRAAAGDPDVSGFFDFTVDAIANTVFSVPVGFCSGPITVTARTFPQPLPPPPGRGLVLVTELAHPSFQLEAVSTFPADRLQNVIFNFGIRNTTACSNIGTDPIPPACIFANPGGGIADVTLVEGGVPEQTTINFFNRSRPGRVKVCKIAGPGIPEGTIFRFRVQGTGPSNPFPGPQLPGVAVDTTVDVPAGPAAQGGFCQFVDSLFIIGTTVTITELLPTITPVPGVPPGEIRVSRIRVSVGPAVANYATRTVTMIARREIIEAEFTNFVFRPTLLKICKIAGPGVAVGTPFTFSVVIDDEGGLFAPPSTIAVPNVTVQAGPASQGGFCAFAQGPYTPTATVPPVGTFRVGSRVYVTEAAAPGTVAISSPTGTVLPCVPAAARCGSLILGFPNGFNELTFTNTLAAPPPALRPVAFDFDGDRKADLSIFRGSSRTWWWAASGENGAQHALLWGLENDRLVAADYDGDGKTDPAIYRDGLWFVAGSRDGEMAFRFGAAGDIPQVGDFDGDGRNDPTVYRPSEGMWYILGSRDGFFGTNFGNSTDRPVAADYDGDGRTDVAVYRNGTWYLLQSRDGFTGAQWGVATDKVLPRDYDGDGKADLAVYRGGTWYILKTTGGYSSFVFGGADDQPVPADYDGDGKTDAAYVHDGTWHILPSSTTSNSTGMSVNFGFGTDVPVPGQ